MVFPYFYFFQRKEFESPVIYVIHKLGGIGGMGPH